MGKKHANQTYARFETLGEEAGTHIEVTVRTDVPSGRHPNRQSPARRRTRAPPSEWKTTGGGT